MMYARPRIVAAYILAIPLAMILGILAASPDELTFLLLGILLFFLSLPLLLKWHHALLILSWNAVFSLMFLPGTPNFSLFLSILSFSLTLLSYIMGRRPFLPVAEMSGPLTFLIAVLGFTAVYRGGIGLKILGGSSYGSKHYIYIFGAIMGYLALTGAQIPLSKARKMGQLFFLSGTTFALSNVAYIMGPAFYFVYWVVPSGLVVDQVATDWGVGTLDRLLGFGPACTAALLFLMAHYGIRGLFDWKRPWRFAVLGMVITMGLYAGFRSVLAGIAVLFCIQFCLEGLLRTRLFPLMIALGLCFSIVVITFANRMPPSIQRAISFLPVNVDASIRADAMGTAEWRFEIWSYVLKMLPKYLIIGKGYSIGGTDMENTFQAVHSGALANTEEALAAGDYHSGPLSVLVPLGIPGAIAFLWLLSAGYRVLYSNYQNGDPRLRLINTTLFSYYLTNILLFFLVFGAFSTQLNLFLGAIGLSVSLNGGVQRRPKTGLEPRDLSQPQAYAMEIS